MKRSRKRVEHISNLTAAVTADWLQLNSKRSESWKAVDADRRTTTTTTGPRRKETGVAVTWPAAGLLKKTGVAYC